MFVSSGVFTNTGFNSGGVFTYVSNNDTNGVFYYRGTNNGSTSWSNPHTAGRINLYASSSVNTIDVLVDRANSDNNSHYTNSAPGEWVGVDLNPYKLVCTTVNIQNTDAYITVNWNFQGSNNNSSWTTLSTVTSNPATSYAWVTRTVTNTTAWRYFRILMNGFDSQGGQYLIFSEFELYGTLSLI